MECLAAIEVAARAVQDVSYFRLRCSVFKNEVPVDGSGWGRISASFFREAHFNPMMVRGLERSFAFIFICECCGSS